MEVCTQCKKEFDGTAHYGKYNRPFCGECYEALMTRRNEKRNPSAPHIDFPAAPPTPGPIWKKAVLAAFILAVLTAICVSLLL
jgi:predicted RNA-binding Zn-ribbon protein involved in translation (DUF1610 family)